MTIEMSKIIHSSRKSAFLPNLPPPWYSYSGNSHHHLLLTFLFLLHLLKSIHIYPQADETAFRLSLCEITWVKFRLFFIFLSLSLSPFSLILCKGGKIIFSPLLQVLGWDNLCNVKDYEKTEKEDFLPYYADPSFASPKTNFGL